MVIAGIGVMAVYAVVSVVAGRKAACKLMAANCRARWGLHAGLLAVLVYGASMATVHMMFAFRHFTPYLAATALALAHLAQRAGNQQPSACSSRATYAAGHGRISHPRGSRRSSRCVVSPIARGSRHVWRICANRARPVYTQLHSGDEEERSRHQGALGPSRPARDRRGYGHSQPAPFRTRIARRTSSSSSSHTGTIARRRRTASRPDARVWRAHADYIHAFTRHGSLPRLLAPVQRRQVRLISEQLIHFNGRDEKLLVYYNPAPLPNVLPPRIDDSCTDVRGEGR